MTLLLQQAFLAAGAIMLITAVGAGAGLCGAVLIGLKARAAANRTR